METEEPKTPGKQEASASAEKVASFPDEIPGYLQKYALGEVGKHWKSSDHARAAEFFRDVIKWGQPKTTNQQLKDRFGRSWQQERLNYMARYYAIVTLLKNGVAQQAHLPGNPILSPLKLAETRFHDKRFKEVIKHFYPENSKWDKDYQLGFFRLPDVGPSVKELEEERKLRNAPPDIIIDSDEPPKKSAASPESSSSTGGTPKDTHVPGTTPPRHSSPESEPQFPSHASTPGGSSPEKTELELADIWNSAIDEVPPNATLDNFRAVIGDAMFEKYRGRFEFYYTDMKNNAPKEKKKSTPKAPKHQPLQPKTDWAKNTPFFRKDAHEIAVHWGLTHGEAAKMNPIYMEKRKEVLAGRTPKRGEQLRVDKELIRKDLEDALGRVIVTPGKKEQIAEEMATEIVEDEEVKAVYSSKKPQPTGVRTPARSQPNIYPPGVSHPPDPLDFSGGTTPNTAERQAGIEGPTPPQTPMGKALPLLPEDVKNTYKNAWKNYAGSAPVSDENLRTFWQYMARTFPNAPTFDAGRRAQIEGWIRETILPKDRAERGIQPARPEQAQTLNRNQAIQASIGGASREYAPVSGFEGFSVASTSVYSEYDLTPQTSVVLSTISKAAAIHEAHQAAKFQEDVRKATKRKHKRGPSLEFWHPIKKRLVNV